MKRLHARVPFLGVALCLCAIFFALSCQGPVGPQGPPGLPGPSGAPGPQAQVVNITVAVGDWRLANTGAPGEYIQSGWKTAANITQSIINTGVVLVYMQMESNPSTWQQLPITFYGQNVFQVIDAQYRAGQVQIFINQSNASAPPTPQGTLTFRVVAIAGISVAELQKTVDIQSYQDVAAAFHLDRP
jgi:hypothetical protein